MAENDAGKVALGAGLGGLAVFLAGRGKGQPVTDEALMNLLAAIAQTEQDILTAVQGILVPGALGTIGVVPNTSGVVSFRLQCPAAATAYKLPECAIPDGFELAIKGWPANAGLIYVAGAQLEAININQVWPLLPNEVIHYKVSNAKSIWVSAVTAGDIVVCTVEQRR
jgi:hypothetical protein